MDCRIDWVEMFRRIRIPTEDESPLRSLVRSVGVVIVFVCVGILFWKNYESTLDKIVSRQTIYDATNTLTPSQKRIIKDFSRYLREVYGLDFRVNVSKTHLILPQDESKKILYIAICPSKRRALIIFPVILKRALPVKFVKYMEGPFVHRKLVSQDWPIYLMEGIHLIYDQLEKMGK